MANVFAVCIDFKFDVKANQLTIIEIQDQFSSGSKGAKDGDVPIGYLFYYLIQSGYTIARVDTPTEPRCFEHPPKMVPYTFEVDSDNEPLNTNEYIFEMGYEHLANYLDHNQDKKLIVVPATSDHNYTRNQVTQYNQRTGHSVPVINDHPLSSMIYDDKFAAEHLFKVSGIQRLPTVLVDLEDEDMKDLTEGKFDPESKIAIKPCDSAQGYGFMIITPSEFKRTVNLYRDSYPRKFNSSSTHSPAWQFINSDMTKNPHNVFVLASNIVSAPVQIKNGSNRLDGKYEAVGRLFGLVEVTDKGEVQIDLHTPYWKCPAFQADGAQGTDRFLSSIGENGEGSAPIDEKYLDDIMETLAKQLGKTFSNLVQFKDFSDFIIGMIKSEIYPAYFSKRLYKYFEDVTVSDALVEVIQNKIAEQDNYQTEWKRFYIALVIKASKNRRNILYFDDVNDTSYEHEKKILNSAHRFSCRLFIRCNR